MPWEMVGPEILAMADLITDDVEADGLYKAFEKWVYCNRKTEFPFGAQFVFYAGLRPINFFQEVQEIANSDIPDTDD